MCGIAAAINCDDSKDVVQSLISGLLHRGEISDPIFNPTPNLAIATRRLPIVDPSHAVQPQWSFDSRIAVALNGEIYNHRALRIEMERQGVNFRTESDTEVLASALSLWGPSALERLNGMYAFVAIDISTGAFLAARDPLGVKPLYLIQSGAGFVFCSEIRPLLATVETGDVMFVPPGHIITPEGCRRFASLFRATETPQGRPDVHELDRLLANAVHTRIPPGLPVAIMFSGGIDSTLIAHYARQICPKTPAYFLGGHQAPDYDYAKTYADLTGLELREVGFEPGSIETFGRFAEIVVTLEAFEPEVVRASLCTAVLSERIHHDGFKVALSGEGADELFAGYIALEAACGESQAIGDAVRDQCLGMMHRTNLQRLDRCSMRYQLEAREPFLDPNIVDYALNLPVESLAPRIDGRPKGKAPLRDLYDLYPAALPKLIRDRAKAPLNEGSGFDGGPGRSPWTNFAEEWVSEDAFADGRRRFAAFDLRSREEFLYLDALAASMDVFRVPHLATRTRLLMPAIETSEALS